MNRLLNTIAAHCALVACAITVAGCGGNPTGAGTAAVIQMSANPSSINPVECPPAHCGTLAGQLEVTSTITIRETAGVGGVVNRMTLTLRRQSDNAIVATGEASAASGLRWSANGLATVPIAMHFDAAGSERNMKIVVTLEGLDDAGHHIAVTIEIEVISL